MHNERLIISSNLDFAHHEHQRVNPVEKRERALNAEAGRTGGQIVPSRWDELAAVVRRIGVKRERAGLRAVSER